MNKIKIAMVAASWHEDLVNIATSSCLEELSKLGIDTKNNVTLFKVPGSLEIPFVAKQIIQNGRWDGVIAFGLVVDGGIYRHEFVAQTVLDGLMRVGLDTNVPVFSAVLTPQKFDENNPKDIEFFRNHLVIKGAEVARSAVKTIQLTQTISKKTKND